MAILIEGIRIEQFTVKRVSNEGGADTVTIDGTYCLMGPEGRIVARQTFGDTYNPSVKLSVSAELAAALKATSDVLRKEIGAILGM